MSNLKIYLSLSDKKDVENYSVTCWKDSKKKQKISTINFKSDENYESIDKVNEFLLTKVGEHDGLEIKIGNDLKDLTSDFVDIINEVIKIWTEEFKYVRDELKKITES